MTFFTFHDKKNVTVEPVTLMHKKAGREFDPNRQRYRSGCLKKLSSVVNDLRMFADRFIQNKARTLRHILCNL